MKLCKLDKTHTLTFTRYNPIQGNTVVFNSSGRTVKPTDTESIIAVGSLQPYGEKNVRKPLPEGFRTENAYVFYTDAVLRTTEQFNNTIPDETLINGLNYKVVTKGDWNSFGTKADNQEYYLALVQPEGS